MEAISREIKNVWIYTRRRGDDSELQRQSNALKWDAMNAGYTVVGCSSDDADDWLIFRPGLKQALRAVREGKVDAIMVTRLSNVSHSWPLLLHVLRILQNHDAVLLAKGEQLRYALAEHDLERYLMKRANRKRVSVPWI